MEHDLQSARKQQAHTKNKLEEEVLDLRKKLRDTEAKYSNLAATPPKVSCANYDDATIERGSWKFSVVKKVLKISYLVYLSYGSAI